MESPRLPRFNRSASISPVRLTNRDRQILAHVRQHRFLRSDHLTELVDGSPQQIVRRLQPLYHHGYLERPRCQIDYFHNGSRRIVYGLGSKGAALLRREFDIPFEQMQWERQGQVRRLFLEHTLMISDFMVSLEMACRASPNIRLIRPEEMELPSVLAKRRDPFRWAVSLAGGQVCGIIPDRVFGLEFTDGTGQMQHSFFFLEADRGTMPVTRSGLGKTSFYRKLLAYEATWKQNLHRTRFGWQRFRVLTVTTTAARAEALIGAARGLKHGRGLFLFTDVRTLTAKSALFGNNWRGCYSDTRTGLLD